MILGSRRAMSAIIASVLTWATAAPALAEPLVGLSQIGRFQVLIGFDSNSPTLPTNLQIIRGVSRGEILVAIDVRPATGELFSVAVNGNNAQLYSIDLGNGQATPIGSVFNNLDNLGDTQFGFDFNPTIDRARLVSTTGQNLVFNPDTGAVTEATDQFYGMGDANEGEIPNVSNNAYDNNVGGAMATVQRVIDTDLDILATLANNAGTLATIGPLGINVVSATGFDVSGASGIGYAIMTRNRFPVHQLFTIDLQTGQATAIGIPLLGLLPINGLTTLSPPL